MPTFDSPQPITVDVEIGVGVIRVTASDRADAVADVRPSDPKSKDDVTAAEATGVDFADGSLTVAGPSSWKRWSLRGYRGSVDVDLQVPTGSRVRAVGGVAHLRCLGDLDDVAFRTGVGDMSVAGAAHVSFRAGVGDLSVQRAESLEAKAGAGDVEVGDVSNKADVKTAGEIRLRTVGGPAVVRNTSGDTWVGEAAGDLRVQAANGSVTIDVARATVVAKTASGDVSLGRASGTSVAVESGMGTIEVGVPEGAAAWLDVETKFGNVQSDLGTIDAPGPGTHAIEVRARTSMGDISIWQVAEEKSER